MKNPHIKFNSRGASALASYVDAPERDIDLYELMVGIARRWRMIAVLVIGTFIVVAVILMLTKPRYSSEVRILFGNTEAETLNNGRGDNGLGASRDLVRSQVHVLQSRDLMAQVITDLNLTQDSEFVSANANLSFRKTLFIWLGFANDPRLLSPQERAWSTLAPRLVVYPLPDSRVIALDVWSHKPELAASIANRLAEVYINETKAAKSRSNRQATEWLASRIQDLQKKVRTAEAEVESFRVQAGLLQGATTTLNAQELSEINSQIIVAKANRSQAQARARQIAKLLKANGEINASTEVLQSPFIRRLREQQVTLRRLVADLSSKYLPSHPRMVRLNAEIRDLSRQVRTEMRKIVSSLQGQVDVATARVASLNANLERVKVTAGQANNSQVRLKELERNALASSQLLETYLRRFREASTRADIETQSPNARIISKAYVSVTPSYPKKGPILILLTLGALILGIIGAFLLEVFSAAPLRRGLHAGKTTSVSARNIQRENILAQALGTFKNAGGNKSPAQPARAEAPMVREDEDDTSIQVSIIAELPEISQQNPHLQEIEKLLRKLVLEDAFYREGITGLQSFISDALPAGRGGKILAMSNLHNFDKSVAALALVRKLSAEGHSVLLIDADFQMQNLTRSLNLTALDGAANLITGSALFSDVVIQDTYSSAHIIAAGERLEFRDDDEAGVRLDAVVDAFAHAYDYVIIDGGMAYPAAPMWSLTQSSDANIVFMADVESEEVVEDLVARIYEHAPGAALGIVSVENKTPVDAFKSRKLFRHEAAA